MKDKPVCRVPFSNLGNGDPIGIVLNVQVFLWGNSKGKAVLRNFQHNFDQVFPVFEIDFETQKLQQTLQFYGMNTVLGEFFNQFQQVYCTLCRQFVVIYQTTFHNALYDALFANGMFAKKKNTILIVIHTKRFLNTNLCKFVVHFFSSTSLM